MKKSNIFISHRGNLIGPDYSTENTEESIVYAIEKGFDVEIDVRWHRERLYLGHDEPQREVSLNFVNTYSDKLWIHCKDLNILDFFINQKCSLNYFWHESDRYTLTSKGYIWCYPGVDTTQRSIIVASNTETYINKPCLGICSDYILNVRHEYNKI